MSKYECNNNIVDIRYNKNNILFITYTIYRSSSDTFRYTMDVILHNYI